MADRYRVEKWREVYAPNPAMLRLKLQQEGYRVFQWADNPGTIYGSHKHSQAQCHWVVSGVLEIEVETVGTVQLQAGDRDFLPAEAYHKARVIGEEPVLYLVGEKLPPKKKRGRPKKVKPVEEEPLPPEMLMLLRMKQ